MLWLAVAQLNQVMYWAHVHSCCRFGHWCLDGSGLNEGGVAGIIVAGILAMAVMGTLMWLAVATLRRWDTPDPVARAAAQAQKDAVEVRTRSVALQGQQCMPSSARHEKSLGSHTWNAAVAGCGRSAKMGHTRPCGTCSCTGSEGCCGGANGP